MKALHFAENIALGVRSGRRAQPSNRPPRAHRCGRRIYRPTLSVGAVTVAAVSLASCGGQHRGDAIVEANGARYIACGGVMVLSGQGNGYDPATHSNEVFFVDPQGRKRDLREIHNLTITDLLNGSPICPKNPAHSAANR